MIEVFHIAVAMKPLDDSFAENAVKHGVAGVNIDGCRISGEKPSVPQPVGGSGSIYGFKNGEGRSGEMSDNSEGRWPANVIHDGSEEVVEQFPYAESHGGGSSKSGSFFGSIGGAGKIPKGDSGSAARFFFQVNEFEEDTCDAE